MSFADDGKVRGEEGNSEKRGCLKKKAKDRVILYLNVIHHPLFNLDQIKVPINSEHPFTHSAHLAPCLTHTQRRTHTHSTLLK